MQFRDGRERSSGGVTRDRGDLGAGQRREGSDRPRVGERRARVRPHAHGGDHHRNPPTEDTRLPDDLGLDVEGSHQRSLVGGVHLRADRERDRIDIPTVRGLPVQLREPGGGPADERGRARHGLELCPDRADHGARGRVPVREVDEDAGDWDVCEDGLEPPYVVALLVHEERDLERDAGRSGVDDRVRRPASRGHLDPEVGRVCDPAHRRARPHVWHAPAGRSEEPHDDGLGCVATGRLRRTRSLQPQGHPLRDAFARSHRPWFRTLQRRRVGLERRVRPVALVLQLEELSFERELRDHLLGEAHRQVGERGDHREERVPVSELGRDRSRERPADRPVLGRRLVACPDVGPPRMEHAEPDPAVVEVAIGSAVDRERQLAVPGRLDRPVPREPDRVVVMGCVDLDAEASRRSRSILLSTVAGGTVRHSGSRTVTWIREATSEPPHRTSTRSGPSSAAVRSPAWSSASAADLTCRRGGRAPATRRRSDLPPRPGTRRRGSRWSARTSGPAPRDRRPGTAHRRGSGSRGAPRG